jgi:hypothetical protein
MSSPTAVAVKTNIKKQGNVGAAREMWLKITKSDGSALSAASDCDAASQLYYVQNPFGEDMAIVKTIANVITLDAQDGDIDVGLADDAVGTNKGVELVDSLVNTGVAVFDQTVQGAIASTVAYPVWKAASSSTDSYISVWQNADADVSDLRWTVLIKVIPVADLS